MSYRGLIAETVSFRGHNGDQGEAYYGAPDPGGEIPRRRRDPPPAGLGRVDHRGGAQVRPSRLCRHLAAPLLPRRTGQPGRRRARACARRAACPTSRWSATSRAPSRILRAQPNPQRQGRRDRLLLRRSPRLSVRPAGCPRSTPWSTAGAATSSSTTNRSSTPSARSRRSTSPSNCARRCSASSATTTRIPTPTR